MEEKLARAGSQQSNPAHLASMPALDWLRFALAAIVAIEHQGLVFPAPISATHAVDVFLALSGWLVGGIILRTPREGMPRFYFNRATRVWIPYFVALIALYAVAFLKDGIDQNWFKYLFYDATFTHYNFTVFPQAAAELPMQGTGNHFWSISVEEQFYLFVPLAILLPVIGNRTLMWLAAVLAMLLVGGRFVPIALGVLAALAQQRFGDWHLSVPGRAVCIFAMVAAGAALLAMDSIYLSGIAAVAIVLLLSVPGRREPIGLFLGGISFPLYLNAWIGVFAAHLLLRALPLPGWPAEILEFALTVAVAIGFWWCIDRPIMRYRNQWYARRSGIILGVAAYALVGIGLLGGTAMLL